MEPGGAKRSFLRNILARIFLSCVLIIALRFAYVVTIRGESCDVGDFCFFALPENFTAVSGVAELTKPTSTSKKIPDLWTTNGFQKSVQFYSSVFQDLISDAILSPSFKTLCVDTETGADVFALRELGVEDSIGISKKGFKPLVLPGQGSKQPFSRNTFDFIFCGDGVVKNTARPGDLVDEIQRTLKPEGFLVIHTTANDTYSFQSLLGLFSFCTLVKTMDVVDELGGKSPVVRELVLKKLTGEDGIKVTTEKCTVPSYKQELIRKVEPLIEEEPQKPWITLKKNAQKIKYLPSMVDISFKSRYVYVDVGARSYGSSIVSWFKKQYPKQNKTFEIYAVEADRAFYPDYKSKKGVTLLPYAAWVRNESLFFEINQDPGHKGAEKGRGMGRIQPVQASGGSTSSGNIDEIQGFDFAEWLRNTVSERDYVVMKMDVEGTEFVLIPRLFETGAICLIDELFLECHYNRWQKCCPGERSAKYQKTYGQCLGLFSSLRKSGVLVHQWW